MAKSTQDRLKKLYEQFENSDHVLIVINADPDSMASAMGLKRILYRRVANITISNINIIKRPNNLAMIRLLKINMIHLDKIKRNEFNKFIIVDSQPNHNPAFELFSFNIIIDHHPLTSANIQYMDIRPDYGATSTIITEYLKAAPIIPSSKLATALFYGIKTDTNDFERQAVYEDIKAFQYLFKHINISLARKIESTEIDRHFIKYYHLALDKMYIHKGYICTFLGPVTTPDICVLIADFLMKIQAISWSFVLGEYQDKLIIIIRNDGIRKDAGKLAKKRFNNFGSAGGHKSMARAEISPAGLKKVIDYTQPKKFIQWVIKK